MSRPLEQTPLEETRRVRAATQSSWRTWRDWLVRIARRVDRGNLPVVAGGLAFFALLSATPLLIAVVSIYGLVSDPSLVEAQVNRLAEILPDDIRVIVAEQLRSIVALSRDSLSVGALLSIGGALWLASKGTFYLLRSLNTVFGAVETRSILTVKVTSILITTLLVASAVFSFGLVAVLPSALVLVLGRVTLAKTAIELGRWPALAITVSLALSLLYRFGPNREAPARWRWWTPGSVAATIGWLAGSYGFSLYVSRFATFNETYGSLGALVVLMSWLYLSAFLILLGALIDAVPSAQAPDA
jgi:membrane protein